MSVLNQFQRELQKIGRPNHQQIVSHEEVKVDADDDEGQKSPDSSSEDDLEQSVVYSTGGNIYD